MLNLLALLYLAPSAQACSVIAAGDAGSPTIVHNVDWYAKFPGVEGAFFRNAANVSKVGELFGAPGTPATWTSRYRSVTFSIAGAEFPVAGINEKGLSVSVLELVETKYPPATDPRAAVSPTQFAQYQLDRSATIEEVIASDKDIRPQSSIIKMHFFTCDASGKCAVIQFLDGKMHVFQGADLPYAALTNSAYPASVDAAKLCTSDSCDVADKSLWRFAEVNRLAPSLAGGNLPERAYQVLDHVKQEANTVTRFQMIYNADKGDFTVRRAGSDNVARLHAAFSDKTCAGAHPYIPIDEGTNGDVSKSWTQFTPEKGIEMSQRMGYPASLANVSGVYSFQKTSGGECSASARKIRARAPASK